MDEIDSALDEEMGYNFVGSPVRVPKSVQREIIFKGLPRSAEEPAEAVDTPYLRVMDDPEIFTYFIMSVSILILK